MSIYIPWPILVFYYVGAGLVVTFIAAAFGAFDNLRNDAVRRVALTTSALVWPLWLVWLVLMAMWQALRITVGNVQDYRHARRRR